MSWREYDYYPRTRRKTAKGGIKAQSKRGQFGESWWAKRWIAVLEGFNIGARLGRGRSYARSGQVLSVDIEKGTVNAAVQGSRTKPYSVSIHVKPLSPAEWKKLIIVLSGQAIFAAKLLAGEMPQDIEQVFKDGGLSLFPEKLKDLETNCSCPDYSNPCKHIAAVYYLLGEEFDRNPFLIFKLRGMDRDELLANLGGVETESHGATQPREPLLPPEPLATDKKTYWDGGDLPGDLFGEVRIPPMRAALLKRLGNFPFWRGEQALQEALDPLYSQASQRGMDVYLGRQERE
jgi:uncharacterized Zn finger protein